jgi:hypothetical protein
VLQSVWFFVDPKTQLFAELFKLKPMPVFTGYWGKIVDTGHGVQLYSD